jgi:hypothetical protein
MKPKFIRTNMYTKQITNGIDELDISNNIMDLFKVTKPLRYYQVGRYEDQRPDLICDNIYGNTDYWWILVQFNDIVDVFTELKEGMVLKVPSVKDINEFINKARRSVDKKQNLIDERLKKE